MTDYNTMPQALDELRVEVRELKSLILEQRSQTTIEPEGYFGTKKAQAFLENYLDGFSMSQFEKLAAKGELPSYKLGDTNKYKLSELKTWADNRMVSQINQSDSAVANIAESARKKQK